MFKVLENKQTPKLQEMSLQDSLDFLSKEKDKLKAFLNFTIGLKKAAGLASNQCGFDKRFCAVQLKSGWEMLINPIITEYIGESSNEQEGCLSWPNNYILAERHETIEVNYININGEEIKSTLSGWEAQVVQHEVDHLNGVEETLVDKDYKTIKREQPKVGRNDPCPCGSGKKHKKCCG